MASCSFSPVRRGDISLKAEELVEIKRVQEGRATVSKEDGSSGTVPVAFLEPADLPGDSFAEQIEQRRLWLTAVDGRKTMTTNRISPFSSEYPSDKTRPTVSDGRPEFLISLNDICVREGDRCELSPLVSSSVPFSLTWRGPAIEAGRAVVESDGIQSHMIIPAVVPFDAGPYSVVAENEFGVSSAAALISVAARPDPPTNVVLARTGAFSLRIEWTKCRSSPVRYGIEYKREGVTSFETAATGLTRHKFSIRGFHSARYILRVFSYNSDFRSNSSNEVSIDFGLPFLETGSDSSASDDRTPFSRSESI